MTNGKLHVVPLDAIDAIEVVSWNSTLNSYIIYKNNNSIELSRIADVSKGLVAEKIFSSLTESGKQADFVLCVGDDRSDEDMFEIVSSAISRNILSSNASVFACTVGQKPSKAKYYLDDTYEVINMLESLAEESDSSPCIEESRDSS
ncbi:trehalose synthase-like protein [Trifolium pratense]|uniref:Trehalose synthase-like protein n=1 Tax=Trifolium pratense TaxID=57577 RepID=A0A2K3MDK5_TRIPR|nr:trehalose synthase-like protein [Trifolium pratense]